MYSADGIVFKLVREYPYMKVVMVDYSQSVFSQTIKGDDTPIFLHAEVLLGSATAENFIKSGKSTIKIIGGRKNDTILGSSQAG